MPGALPGTVVLLLRGAPHPVFSRCLASDLVAAVPLPLVRALTGGSVSINTLDGRVLAVPLQELVTPGLTMRVAGEGMPLPGGGGAKVSRSSLLSPVHACGCYEHACALLACCHAALCRCRPGRPAAGAFARVSAKPQPAAEDAAQSSTVPAAQARHRAVQGAARL